MNEPDLLAAIHRHHVVIYGRMSCGFCVMTTRWMQSRGIPYEFIVTSGNPALRAALAEVSGQPTVPQIFVGGVSIGGYQDLLGRSAEDDFLRALERRSADNET